MKLAILASYAPSLLKFRKPLLQALIAQGHQVTAYAPKESFPIESDLDALGVHFVDTPLQRTGTNPWHDLQYLRFLQKHFSQSQPDAVLAYTIKPVVYGSIAASWANVPRRVALITGLGYAFTQNSGKAFWLQKLIQPLYQYGLANAQKVLFQNPDDQALFIAKGLVDSSKCSVIAGSGVPLDEYPQIKLPAPPYRFLLVARLLKDKGIYEYVEAARKVKEVFPDAHFQLLGPTDSNPAAIPMAEVESWVQEGVVEYIPEQEHVAPFYQQCHVYVLPSYREGTPRSVLEAMATGRPIITTDAPGCRETIQPGNNGLLVPIQNAQALAEAMLQLLQHPERLAQMGEASRQYATSKYDVHHVNKVIIQALCFE